MADLQLHVGGDSGEAQQALHDAGGAAHDAHDEFKDLNDIAKELKESFTAGALAAQGVEKALEALKEGLKESWEEAAKAENAHRQLAVAAGELTKEFEEQAEVLGKNLAIKADDIEHMQTMLLRYGAAPEVIGQAIVAVQNYAAATGQDANSAMMMLIRGVEAGHGSLGRMGVKFQETGSFATDLGNAVGALNDKFGGAAETEAGGMTGRTRAASVALDEMKAAFGGLMGTIEDKLGILAAVTKYMNDITAGVKALSNLNLGGVVGAYAKTLGGPLSNGIGAPAYAAYSALSALSGGGKEGVPSVEGASPFAAGGGVDVSMGDLELSPSKKALADGEKRQEEYLNKENEWYDKQWVAAQKSQEELLKILSEEAKEELKIMDEKHKAMLEDLKQNDELDKKQVEGFMKAEDEQTKDLNQLWTAFEEGKKGEEQSWFKTGAKLGEAFGKAFAEGVKGGANSAEDAMLGLVDAMLTIIGGVVGGVAGEGNPAAIQAGQTIGHLAGTGIKALAQSHHTGGWIERYHSGGWPGLALDERPAILQTGERVLSRREVANAGGTAAVDSMVRGGGRPALQVYVNTFDVQSTREFFENQGGRGFYNALRTGRGQLYSLFGSP
jgi:hypothetical protein